MEHRTHISLREELRKFLVELRIPGNDDGDGSGHGFFDIGGRKSGTESLFGFDRSQEDKARRRRIGARRTEGGKSRSLLMKRVVDWCIGLCVDTVGCKTQAETIEDRMPANEIP